jgi:hypothetical protein
MLFDLALSLAECVPGPWMCLQTHMRTQIRAGWRRIPTIPAVPRLPYLHECEPSLGNQTMRTLRDQLIQEQAEYLQREHRPIENIFVNCNLTC